MTIRLKDGGPAFPVIIHPSPQEHANGQLPRQVTGISMRQYYAAHAPDVPEDFAWIKGETDMVQRICRWRWHYADMMLETERGGL